MNNSREYGYIGRSQARVPRIRVGISLLRLSYSYKRDSNLKTNFIKSST